MVLVVEVPGLPDPQTLYIESFSGSAAYGNGAFALQEIHGTVRSVTYKANFAFSGQAGIYSEKTLASGVAKDAAARALSAITQKFTRQ
jgi:hypothetical protein